MRFILDQTLQIILQVLHTKQAFDSDEVQHENTEKITQNIINSIGVMTKKKMNRTGIGK